MKSTTPGSLPTAAGNIIPSTLQSPDAVRFWLAVLFTGVGTGIGAAALTRLLEVVQHVAWSGSATNILDAAQRATPLRHIVVLLAAAALTGIGQLLLKHLSSGNGIDTTAAIWFHAGRMPALRTLARYSPTFFLTKGVCRTSSAGCWSLAGRVLEWERRTEFPWAVRSLHWKSR